MAKKSPYSMHPGFAMEESSMRMLKERTGKTLDQWIARVKKEGPADEKPRREWLKKQGLTTNYCTWVAERAAGKGSPADYDPEAYVEGMFEKKPDLRPVYDRLLKMCLGIAKDVKACPCQTIVPLYRNHVIGQIKPRTRTVIDMGFALRDMKPTGRLVSTGGFEKKDRITHKIEITKLGDINAEVEKWLKRAYEIDG